MLFVQLNPPHGLSGRGKISTKKKVQTNCKFNFKGKTVYGVEAAELAGEIRSVLEALQHAHCEANPVVVRVTKDDVLENGTIYAWTRESEEIAEMAVAKIDLIIAKLQELPLTDFEVFVKVTIEQTLAVDA